MDSLEAVRLHWHPSIPDVQLMRRSQSVVEMNGQMNVFRGSIQRRPKSMSASIPPRLAISTIWDGDDDDEYF